MHESEDVTLLVQQWSAGDAQALERLLPLVYAELRRLARIQLSKQPGHDTLQATALVNDVLLKLIDRDGQH
ncbi:MAG: ECF-type sigma factor, partial [Pseudomonadota bacterium]|nr:ECF-type sigma factor [Pseudomonadota bacterium]